MRRNEPKSQLIFTTYSKYGIILKNHKFLILAGTHLHIDF